MTDHMNKIFRYFLLFCVAVLLTSCGTARKAEEKEKEAKPPHTPPVVVPETWRETIQ